MIKITCVVIVMNELYTEFENWLNNQLENNDMPENTLAFCFNLYEESVEDSVYSVQIVACDKFDKDDSDWACEEVWSSEEDIFGVELSDEQEKDWSAAQKLITEWVEDYLANGQYRDVFSGKPVAIGFVDGELEIIQS